MNTPGKGLRSYYWLFPCYLRLTTTHLYTPFIHSIYILRNTKKRCTTIINTNDAQTDSYFLYQLVRITPSLLIPL